MNCRFPRPNASVRLFCFPWAGGGANFYTAWGEDVSEDIEVYGVCLTGRESRYNEPCTSDGPETVNWIASTIYEQYSDKEIVFYGHSMGALLAFLVAKELKHKYNKEPKWLFLSGTTAPHSPLRSVRSHFTKTMTKTEFWDKLRSLGGTPAEILDSPDLMDLFFPQLSADIIMVPTLRYEHNLDDKPPLSCPIDFFDGADDIDHDIAAWRQVTSGPFSFLTMPGGHFFLKTPENTKKLLHYFDLRLGGYHDIV